MIKIEVMNKVVINTEGILAGVSLVVARVLSFVIVPFNTVLSPCKYMISIGGALNSPDYTIEKSQLRLVLSSSP